MTPDDYSGGMERRSATRVPVTNKPWVTLMWSDSVGGKKEVTVRAVDWSGTGLGIDSPIGLAQGAIVNVRGDIEAEGVIHKLDCAAHIVWCERRPAGGFQAGLEFQGDSKKDGTQSSQQPVHDDGVDYYDALQVSPKADTETIHKVFRMLAQRYHPDNSETGNDKVFRSVVAAYGVLSDPEKRAAYDVQWNQKKELRWRIFDGASSTLGVEAEQRKRAGILSLLYTKRVRQPHTPEMTIKELEDLLGCPAEHLEFCMWFLRELGWVVRTDSGRCSITVAGAKEAEVLALAAKAEPAAGLRMLPEG
jgi:hypothetical protein